MLLEICASNYQSALNAEAAGAQRIELCSELAVGGITPSHGLIQKVIDTLKIPVFVLIRPRSGSFFYSEEEFEIMKADIEMCKTLGCKGIVSGVLNSDHTIDANRTKELMNLCDPMEFTFHRAFDQTPNPFEALKTLKNIGVIRILSAGQTSSAEKGIVVLKQLLELSGEELTIMPGSGINELNCLIFKGAGFKEIHASVSQLDVISSAPKVAMNSSKFFDETIGITSNPLRIRSIIEKISAI